MHRSRFQALVSAFSVIFNNSGYNALAGRRRMCEGVCLSHLKSPLSANLEDYIYRRQGRCLTRCLIFMERLVNHYYELNEAFSCKLRGCLLLPLTNNNII